MEQKQNLQSCLVLWRGRKLVVEMNPSETLRDLGKKLQELTNIEADTLRLLIPTEKSSKLIYPFSDDHSCLTLDSTSLFKVKSIRMMGVPKDEVDEVLKNAKADLRIAGFDEEEKRMKQRNINRSYSSPKLPQGTYVFCDFRTLSLPGIELDPPASKALELLHKLASDPGIVAIMNKHRWRVGILTEMAPIGYVGVTPKCILGFNQNHGEEISLRLRTDDLKGFRKYGSIKKTLLHELAHMVFSEHDSNFYALDSQLNKEAANLDWTRSRGHTLSGVTNSQHYEDEFDITSNATPSQKIGGQASALPNARAASVSAAFDRLANSFTTFSSASEVHKNSKSNNNAFYTLPKTCGEKNCNLTIQMDVQELGAVSNDSKGDESMDPRHTKTPLPAALENDKSEQSNPYNSAVSPIEPNCNADIQRKVLEPELVDSGEEPNHRSFDNTVVPDQRDSVTPMNIEFPSHGNEMQIEPDSGEPITRSQTAEPDPNDPELQIIQDPVTVVLGRLQSAIQLLKYQVTPSETGRVLQTLIKIIRNVIEHPDDIKFKKLRKANPTIQMNILTYKAAMDILTMIGFVEDVIVDEWGKADAFLMLKRNDPGLLWLAKSSLETYIT